MRRARSRSRLATTFALLAARYWLTVFPLLAVELRRLRARAREIRDPELRGVALEALAKRSNLEGAAAFAALTPLRSRAASTRALLAFQSIYNYADALAEHPSPACRDAARSAHAALTLALTTRSGLQDSAQHGGDSDYLLPQIERCRRALDTLPAYDHASPAALCAASRICSFQTQTSPPAAGLEAWARSLVIPTPAASWWESAGAAGSSLAVHALISAAATPGLDAETVEALTGAYGGAIGALHSLLDSLIDQDEDAASGQPSLIGLYHSSAAAAHGMGNLASRALAAAMTLPQSRRHAVLVASMASMYLSA
ncbi:MAG: DUF2600 family protein, partial [Solirubrobacterales bacterium]|nr:DUF2600 family protein [Solirubrobacterales bacterium]